VKNGVPCSVAKGRRVMTNEATLVILSVNDKKTLITCSDYLLNRVK